MHKEILADLNRARHQGLAVVRAVSLGSGEEALIFPPAGANELERAASAAARADQSGTVEVEGHRWFLSVHNPPLDLAIIGAVHIAQPLAQMASLAGYQVRIIDPRTAFATSLRFPGFSLSHDWPDEALGTTPLGSRSALVALTHDPKLDDPAITAALRSPCFYIGALGSKKTHAARLERLKDHGLGTEELSQIHGPIGLPIGARSPAEIAIAILAEMTQCLRKGDETRATPGPALTSS